jgi:hypothetical protein
MSARPAGADTELGGFLRRRNKATNVSSRDSGKGTTAQSVRHTLGEGGARSGVGHLTSRRTATNDKMTENRGDS